MSDAYADGAAYTHGATGGEHGGDDRRHREWGAVAKGNEGHDAGERK